MMGSYEWCWFTRPGMATSDANVLEHKQRWFKVGKLLKRSFTHSEEFERAACQNCDHRNLQSIQKINYSFSSAEFEYETVGVLLPTDKNTNFYS